MAAGPGGGDREEYRGKLTPNYGILTPGMSSSELTMGLGSEFDAWIDERKRGEADADRQSAVP